jgi:hypothetical protein
VSASSQRFLHGTSDVCAYGIAAEGFRAFPELRPYLGSGVYLTRSLETAKFYGLVILEVALAPGTRIVDLTPPADPAVIDYLRREFGKEVLDRPLRRVLPANKQLRRHELVELLRYRWKLWDAVLGRSNPHSRPRYRHRHAALVEGIQALRRYGIEAAGDPEGEMGLVVVVPSRARPIAVHAKFHLPGFAAPSLPLGPIENVLDAPNAAELRLRWQDLVNPEE